MGFFSRETHSNYSGDNNEVHRTTTIKGSSSRYSENEHPDGSKTERHDSYRNSEGKIRHTNYPDTPPCSGKNITYDNIETNVNFPESID